LFVCGEYLVKARRAIEVVLPGIADIDVDLELEEEIHS